MTFVPGDSARLEAFSDGVFAFAATLLVVALEVPSTVLELEHLCLEVAGRTLVRDLTLYLPQGERVGIVFSGIYRG